MEQRVRLRIGERREAHGARLKVRIQNPEFRREEGILAAGSVTLWLGENDGMLESWGALTTKGLSLIVSSLVSTGTDSR
jgi:hypothetical protein